MPRDTNTKRWSKEVRAVLCLGACAALEDLALRAIVKQWQLNGDNEGRAKWPAIADELNARTGIERAPKQCRERYKNVVADGVVVGQWTESDDAVILQRHTEVGNKWVKIAQFLAGRPENSVKNRYHSLLRRALKGDQYPIQVAKQAGGTAFLAAVELKLAGGAGMMPGMSGGMFTTGMPSHAHSMFMPLHGMQGDAGGNMLVSGGPHTFNDIATATVAAMQAAAAMQESLVSMNTETQIAMIAAAMTGSPDVDPAVQDQLRRSEDLWKGLLSSTASMGGMKGYHGSLPGYPMLAVPPTSAAGPVPVSAAAIPAPAGVSAGMPGPVHLAVSTGDSAQAASVPGVTVASQAPAGLSSAPPVVSAPAAAPTSGAQQHLVRDLMGRDLTISIPNMASGGPGLPGSMGFQLPGGPLSSAGSPMFMFSPSNGPFGVMGLGG
ncbi:V-MYB, partial [Symbiodinium sp. KB8]